MCGEIVASREVKSRKRASSSLRSSTGAPAELAKAQECQCFAAGGPAELS